MTLWLPKYSAASVRLAGFLRGDGEKKKEDGRPRQAGRVQSTAPAEPAPSTARHKEEWRM
jgi:hypothetical protein